MSDNTFSLNRAPGYFFDWTTFLITIGLVALGLISIYSATYDSNMSSYFYRQLTAALIGTSLMIGITYLPEGWVKLNSWTVYGASLLLLLITVLWGTEVNGTKGWLRLFGFSLQPAELAKLGVLMIVANHLSRKGTDVRTWRDSLICIAYSIPHLILIMKQPDFGSATVIIAMLIGIFFWTGFEAFILYSLLALPIIVVSSLKGGIFFFLALIILCGLLFIFRKNIILTISAALLFIGIGFASPVIYEKTIYPNLAEHQKARIETFLNPGTNPRGAGYNVIQSVMAVGSGGLSGKGYLQGTQTQLRYIPMQWTDFIFSVPTEEFGFIGGVIVIILIGALIWRFTDSASTAGSKYQSITIIGTATIFLYHTLINIGMAIGIMPVMGIPLPFLSFGGTALIVNLMLVGLMLNTYRLQKIKRSV